MNPFWTDMHSVVVEWTQWYMHGECWSRDSLGNEIWLVLQRTTRRSVYTSSEGSHSNPWGLYTHIAIFNIKVAVVSQTKRSHWEGKAAIKKYSLLPFQFEIRAWLCRWPMMSQNMNANEHMYRALDVVFLSCVLICVWLFPYCKPVSWRKLSIICFTDNNDVYYIMFCHQKEV